MTGRRTRGGSIAALAACLLALAGCGNDKVRANNAYVAATDRVMQRFNTQFQALQSEFTAVSTPKQDLVTLSRLQDTVDRAAAQLGRVKPPSSIAGLHRTLVARLRSYDAAIATARTGFRVADPAKVAAARTAFSTRLAAVGTAIMATINTINARLR
ncbi:MAG: hypothetical protein JWM31_3563 [Solirubrobacterales bacterium]|nr:hypothetical protein [Solirubrobacterales bacterium]